MTETVERDTAEFVEAMGLFFADSGLPPMAGRMVGWLLICRPEHQTAGDLAAALNASKGSVSTMSRLLLHLGLIERYSISGERGVRLRIRPGVWTEMLRTQIAKLSLIRQLAERGLEVARDHGPDEQGRLLEMRDAYAFMERELPEVLARWERRSADRLLETNRRAAS